MLGNDMVKIGKNVRGCGEKWEVLNFNIFKMKSRNFDKTDLGPKQGNQTIESEHQFIN